MTYLAVYDIANPKRLRLVAKTMKTYGYRVQKSVFECDLDARKLNRLVGDTKQLLDPDHDSVRFYPLPLHALQKQIILGIGPPSMEQQCYIF